MLALELSKHPIKNALAFGRKPCIIDREGLNNRERKEKNDGAHK
jgi:hypothetical protein